MFIIGLGLGCPCGGLLALVWVRWLGLGNVWIERTSEIDQSKAGK